MNIKGPVLAVTGLALWGTAVSWGFSQGMRFEATPGRAATHYPVVIGKGDKWRFVLIATPECPCTVASVSGLKAAVDSYPGSTSCEVVFVGEPDHDSRSYQLARTIDGCSIVEDRDGSEAKRFGAATSGQTYLYAPDGRLAYQGGLTVGRGVDDPRFAMELYSTVRSSNVRPYSPTYGCSLEGVAK